MEMKRLTTIMDQYRRRPSQKYLHHGHTPFAAREMTRKQIAFLRFLSGHVQNFEALQHKHVNEYFAYLKRQGKSTETIYKYQLAISELLQRAPGVPKTVRRYRPLKAVRGRATLAERVMSVLAEGGINLLPETEQKIKEVCSHGR